MKASGPDKDGGRASRGEHERGEVRSGSGSGMPPAALLVAAYAGLVLLPLVLAAIGAPAPRGFWIEFGVGLGFVALAMLGAQFALTARFRKFAGIIGQDTLLQFHRQAALVAFGLALAHPLVLFAAHPPYLAFLDPRVNFARSVALIAVMVLLVLIIVTTIWRAALRIPYAWWRLGHGIMAVFILVIGMAHVLRVHHYVAAPWKQAFWALLVGASMLLLLYVRVLKPLWLLRRPWRVKDVKGEGERSWTLTLEPSGHAGLRFRPGQFAWLTLGTSPFSLEQHPFTMASSAERPAEVQFTIKELGDYTSRIGEVTAGVRAYVEGSYGAFTPDDAAAGLVLIAGGIGITPMMSILRTMRDRGDQREVLLMYATMRVEGTAFVEEIGRLARELRLRFVHVVEEPPGGWGGEKGRITRDMLERYLSDARDGWQYLVCGPEPMMDAAERILLDRGVPLGSVRSERFNIA